jgi:hypothetical protein
MEPSQAAHGHPKKPMNVEEGSDRLANSSKYCTF